MPKAVDITGQRFGRLTAVKRVGTRYGKSLWSFDCDCGTKDFQTTQNAVCAIKRRGHASTQSCGCWNRECLFFGPNPHRVDRPRFVIPITFPIPEVINPKKSAFWNQIQREMLQLKWERVEFESRKIERGTWKEPVEKPFDPRDEYGNRIVPLDLRAMMKEHQEARRNREVPIPEVPSSATCGSSLADRVRIVTDEEWARL